MFEDLVKQNIIIDLQKLVDNVETSDEVDSYGIFMKEVILNTYGIN